MYHYAVIGTIICTGSLLFLGLITPSPASPIHTAGSIQGSKHDLTSLDHRAGTGVMIGVALEDFGGTCIYCHIQHRPSANQSSGDAPLWNREYPVRQYSTYQSPTLDTGSQQPSGVSLACLSCHDGTLAVDKVLKKPILLRTTLPRQTNKSTSQHMKMAKGDDINHCGQCHRSGEDKLTGIHELNLAAFGTNLRDDHPVSMDYPTVKQDPQFHPKPQNDVFTNGIRLFAGRVECASCHDVHDPDTPPFLRAGVKGSALCLTCHKK